MTQEQEDSRQKDDEMRLLMSQESQQDREEIRSGDRMYEAMKPIQSKVRRGYENLLTNRKEKVLTVKTPDAPATVTVKTTEPEQNKPEEYLVTYAVEDPKTGKLRQVTLDKRTGLMYDTTGQPLKEESKREEPRRQERQTQPTQPTQPPQAVSRTTYQYEVRTEALTDDENEQLKELEHDYLESILNKVLKEARDKVGGLRHANLVPFGERELESLTSQMDAFRESLNSLIREAGGDVKENPRTREIMERLDALDEWVKGNVSLLLVGGATLNTFFDGWATLGVAVRAQRRDIKSVELGMKYAGKLKNYKEGSIQEEILRKQDHMNEIYRGVAGIHREQARNGGEKLTDNYEFGYRKVKTDAGVKTESSSEIERKRAKFVEQVLSHGREDVFEVDFDREKGKSNFIEEWRENTVDNNKAFHKGVVWYVDGKVRTFDNNLLKELESRARKGDKVYVKRETQFVESIAEVWKSKDAAEGLRKFFAEPDNKDSKQAILVGHSYVIDNRLIRDLGGQIGKTMWVNGVEWRIDANTINELKWKVGSGDKIFMGRAHEVKKGEALSFGWNQEVALVNKKTALAVDNVFDMDSAEHVMSPTKKKLSLMLDEKIWDKLAEPGANVDEIIRNFNEKLKRHDISSLNAHLIDTERLGLLFMAEGPELGWGFDYKLDQAKTETKKKGLFAGKEPQVSVTKVVKREVSQGSTNAATDLNTSLFWLRTDAANTHKLWPSSILPMDEKIRRQILEHQPGWAPWLGADKTDWKRMDWREIGSKVEGWWQTKMYGHPFKTDIPTKFRMTLLDAVTVTEPTEEMVKLAGKRGKVRPMDLIRKGNRMSEIDWSRLNEEAQYRWLVTFSQLGLLEGMMAKKPDKRFIEQFFGNVENVPAGAYIEELNKRMSLGLRDLPEADAIKKLLPYAVSMYHAWRKGMLPDSLQGVRYVHAEEKRGSRQIFSTLKAMSPGGDAGFGEFVSKRFNYNMEQLRPIGLAHLAKGAEDEPWFDFG